MEPTGDFHPPSERDDDADDAVDAFLRRAPAAMVSVIVHLIVLIVLAFLSLRTQTKDPLVIELGRSTQEAPLEVLSIDVEQADPDVEPETEETLPVTVEMDLVSFEIAPPSPDAVSPNVSLLQMPAAKLKGYSPSFSRRIIDAQTNGIEIVIVFDSTGSMGQEIMAVRQRIRQIGESVLRKIPNAKFSLATYRDLNDQYVARGIPLTTNLPEMERFVTGVVANGGGDRPEAVQAGMLWAMRENVFRSDAQKVMVIFGDAPPHPSRLNTCLDLADEFCGYGKGRVYTVTCRRPSPLPEFYSIARAGGGDAFVMANVHQLMDDLLVITFGVENRDQVLKFFELEQRSDDQRSTRKSSTNRRRPRR